MTKTIFRRIETIIISAVMLVAILPAGAFAAETGSSTCVHFNETRNYDYAFKTLELVNKERATQGATPLKMDREMTDLAMQRAGEIALMFSHSRPNGTTPVYMGGGADGEDIGFGYSTPNAMVEGWMQSPGHRANILDSSYKGIGIGCAKVGDYYYWVQCFSWDNPVEVSKSNYTNKTVKAEIETDYNVLRQNGVELFTDMGPMDVGENVQISLRVLDNNTGLVHYIDSTDFVINSSNNSVASVSGNTIKAVSAGTYNLTVTHKNNSNFAFSEKYNVYGSPKITVKGTSIKKVKRYKKVIKVTWEKKTNITGYQIRYSESKSMTSTKVVKISKAKTTYKKIKRLKKRQRYYVQVRTYKTVNGHTYYSTWSSKKSARTR